MQQVRLDGLQGAAPANDALHDLCIPSMVRDAIEAELDPEQQSDSQGILEAAPLDEVDVDVVALREALLEGLGAVVAVLELDEEGLRVVTGDDDFTVAEPKLVAQHRLNLPRPRTGRRHHGPPDSRRVLPFAQTRVNGVGGWDETFILIRAGGRVSQHRHGSGSRRRRWRGRRWMNVIPPRRRGL